MEQCQESSSSRDISESKKRFGLWFLKWLVNGHYQILTLGIPWIVSDSELFSALTKGVTFHVDDVTGDFCVCAFLC